ncbi:MAG: hypothetical protein CM1200mP38_2410 [Dehalococcoidia bacterium]|nr:MAG: hypothetical protein CM1200mP38_2410 [Dehalococcoidia bacterium]
MFSARITSPKKIEINEIDIPQINEGQCLIKLERWSVWEVTLGTIMGLYFQKKNTYERRWSVP